MKHIFKSVCSEQWARWRGRRMRQSFRFRETAHCPLTLIEVTPYRSASRHFRNQVNQMEPTTLAESERPLTIWTIGHSTRSIEEFNQILISHEIKTLIDVRTFPGSRRYPQFNKQQLSESLEGIGVEYAHVPELGGRRKARPDSKNTAWNNEGFRGYADHMETVEFQKGIEALRELAEQKRAAVMCAEAVWWRCHRSLISDFLKAAGVKVVHILSEKKTEEHPYTPVARLINGRLSYEGLLGE